MKMTTQGKPKAQASFVDEYASFLREYAAGSGEAALGKAYELGRRALTERKSLVEIASLHHKALQGLILEEKDRELRESLLTTNGDFLAECLSPYEMAHRGFQDAVKALRQLNETLEEEIKRIAYAVHDEAGQLLVDSHELRPTILDDLGWIPAIRFLAEGISARAGLPIHIEASVSGRLPGAVETALYRTVQEGLTNAVKHAKARNVWIRAWKERDALCCSIRDDGAGFDPRDVQTEPSRKGLGLIAMRERMSAIGGTLRVESCPGRGTELSVRVPLEVDHANTRSARG